MQPFEYAHPKTLKEALALLGGSWTDAAILAGGTDLLALLKDDIVAPKRLVNIKEIAELRGIATTPKGLRIGAAVTLDELLSNAAVRASFPALAEAARGVASAQIRNMGTVGGDLAQRPRCWYFRSGFGLIPTHEGRNLVVEGDSRYHAIFGDGPARFVSASSFGPALLALGAKLTIASPAGTREVEAARFFVSPANNDARETALLANEILTEVVVPTAPTRNATYEVRQKDALDWPLATCSVALTMKGAAVGTARIVLGHVAPTPYVAAEAAASLAGKTITVATAEAAADLAVAGARPLKDNAYKVTIARTAVKRALLAAAATKG